MRKRNGGVFIEEQVRLIGDIKCWIKSVIDRYISMFVFTRISLGKLQQSYPRTVAVVTVVEKASEKKP